MGGLACGVAIINMMQLMLGLLAALLLGRGSADQSQFQLSPPMPPTAFLAQTYSCQFRVPGLASPAFRFQGLPAGLSGSASGLVRGTPAATGSFLISIGYSSNGYQASKQTVLRVALSGDSPANAHLIDSLLPRFAITSDHSFVCMVGVAVEIRLAAVMGMPPYFWAYLRLPSELRGGNGTITGIFELEGYYSFGVSCADSAGNSTEAYFTLNVQPLAFFASYAPPAARPLAEVPLRDAFATDAWVQAGQAQQAAIACMGKAAEAQAQARSDLATARGKAERSSSLLSAAKQQCESAQKLINVRTDRKAAARSLLNNAAAILAVKNHTRNQKQQRLILQAITTSQASKEVAVAQQAVEQLGVTLHSASSQFIAAQNNSTEAAFLVNAAMLEEAEAKDELANSESALTQAQQQYQSTTATLDQASQQVKLAKDNGDAIRSDKDNVSAVFTSISKNAEDAMDELKRANDAVAVLKVNGSDAKKAIGEAQYSLQMALNQLFVAQAAKEQADKAMLIITTQESPNSPTTAFSGCQQGAFPSIFGSGVVVSMGQSALTLSSGQQLLFGPCTALPSSVEVGAEIYFEGYLREGYGHLLLAGRQE